MNGWNRIDDISWKKQRRDMSSFYLELSLSSFSSRLQSLTKEEEKRKMTVLD